MLDRFRKSYDELKKLLPEELSVDLPGDRLAYSILKGIFQENDEFATKCARQTLELDDIVDVAAGMISASNPLFSALVESCKSDPSVFKAAVKNLAHIAQGFEYK